MAVDAKQHALDMHRQWKGKLEVVSKAPLENRSDLAVAYTPGVAEPCLEIAKDESLAYEYTGKGNTVAVITDGTAVLGLGDIGPQAGMPVMEGKCALLKAFAGIDAIPILLDTKDPDEIIDTVLKISKSFGGINLEDISAPRCFRIERELIEKCDIPVFHDDQHGTAIVVAAGILNALRVTGRTEKTGSLRIVINGAGAAGLSIARLLVQFRLGDILLCDVNGIIYAGSPNNNSEQEALAQVTNKKRQQGTLADACVNADVFVGVSRGGLLKPEMIRSMSAEPIIFAMANPTPEIMPDEALAAGAGVVGTGRSDYPNQMNNVLVFPGIFRGLLDCRARRITESMQVEAAKAIAGVLPSAELSRERIIPDAFDKRVVRAVADAVIREAVRLGLNRI